VEFELDAKGVRIRRAKVSARPGRGATAVSRLRGKATIKLSPDEIMALTRPDWCPSSSTATLSLPSRRTTPCGESGLRGALARGDDESVLVINPIVFAEVSVGFDRVEDLEEALPHDLYRRDPLPYEAAFLARRSFLAYRRPGGHRVTPLPDFYIDAHAAVAGHPLLTRDARRYRTY